MRASRVPPKIDAKDAALIKLLLAREMSQHDIASLFGVNQGRIAEINLGQRYAHIRPADLSKRGTVANLFAIATRWQERMKLQIQRIFMEWKDEAA